MILVHCTTTDRSAIWAAHQLRKRLSVPVHLVSPEMLFAGVWEHRVGDGPVTTRIRISNKLTIESGEVSGVLNRISYLPESLFPRMAAPDRAYAAQECTALYMSWIESLRCPVLNPACSQGLCGAIRPPEHWQALAARVGLPAGTGPGTACGVVIGARWIGPRPDLASKFVRLAEQAAAPILGVEMHGDHVTQAHPLPDFIGYGPAAIDALEEALTAAA